jgi:hypothetical protein
MRVNDRSPLGPAAAEAGRTPETQKPDPGHGPRLIADSGGDRVELSSVLGRLSHAISSFGTQQANRVAALTANYQAGRYRPDSLATSRGMISEAVVTERA